MSIKGISKKVLLLILDGFGIAPPSSGNAVSTARTPNLNLLLSQNPNTQLEASGMAVGLPADQVGNSEVGHLTIGSGRIIQHELLKINQAIENGQLAEHPEIQAIGSGKTCHIISIISSAVSCHVFNPFSIKLLIPFYRC